MSALKMHQLLLDHWVRTCPECEREFSMLEHDEAQEWHYGHDCEVAA
jgi:hypothetical protein